MPSPEGYVPRHRKGDPPAEQRPSVSERIEYCPSCFSYVEPDGVCRNPSCVLGLGAR